MNDDDDIKDLADDLEHKIVMAQLDAYFTQTVEEEAESYAAALKARTQMKNTRWGHLKPHLVQLIIEIIRNERDKED